MVCGIRRCLRSSLFAIQLSAVCLVAAVPAADAAGDFYKGKQIRLLIGTDAGGAYDMYARALSRHMGKHIPGDPTFILENMPGAAGLQAANYIYNVAPRDGTVIAGAPNAIPTAPLTNPGGVKFDPNQLSWIGSATKELYVGYVWHDAPIRTFEEARNTEVLMGGVTVGSFSADVGIMARNFFGMKFKTVIGYKSSPEIQLAVQRGEVHGVMGTAYSALKIAQADWLAQNKIRIIVQYGLQRHPLYPDVPLYIDFAKNEEQRQAILFYTGNLAHGKPYFAPPGIPAERLAILRQAFDETMKDPEFLQDIASGGGDIDGPMTGQALAKFVAEENSTSPRVIQMVHDVLAKF